MYTQGRGMHRLSIGRTRQASWRSRSGQLVKMRAWVSRSRHEFRMWENRQVRSPISHPHLSELINQKLWGWGGKPALLSSFQNILGQGLPESRSGEALPYCIPRHGSFSGGLNGKESACNARDPGSIPRSRRFLGERNGNPLQYSCLEYSMDRGAWKTSVHGIAKSYTWVSD